MKHKINSLVKIKRHKMLTQTTQVGTKWEEYLIPAVIISHLGMQRMRTGMSRFETLDVYEVLVEGKVQKIPAKNIVGI